MAAADALPMREEYAYKNHGESHFHEYDPRYSSSLRPQQGAPQRLAADQHIMDGASGSNKRSSAFQGSGPDGSGDTSTANKARGFHRTHVHNETSTGIDRSFKDIRGPSNTASAYPGDASYGFPFTPQRARSCTASAGTGQAPQT